MDTQRKVETYDLKSKHPLSVLWVEETSISHVMTVIMNAGFRTSDKRGLLNQWISSVSNDMF